MDNNNNNGQWGNQPQQNQPQQPQWQQPQQPQQPQWQQPQQPQQGWGQPQQYQQYQQPQQSYGPPMNWHKFLIFFSLWASAVLNVISGIMTLTGAQYGGYGALVYMVYGGMKPLDIIFGLLCIALAAFGIFTRFQLAGFKKDAPKKLLLLYIVASGASLLYVIAASAITGEMLVGSTTIVNLVVSVVMVIVNKIYYDKRAFMFVN